MDKILVLCLLSVIYSSRCLSAEILEAIDVTDERYSSITFFDSPESSVPHSLTSFDHKKINQANIKKLSDISTLDASVTDSYNSSGYWDIISIRGFTLDNRSSYQREGLPINAETSIPLENKEKIEVLKGLSNLYSGAASPGGLVNYVVKRPGPKDFQTIRAAWSQQNSQLIALDVNRKWLRFNAVQEKIHPLIRDNKGDRSLLSAASNFQISDNSLLEVELEWSRRSQPSIPGFSLLGNRLPSVPDPNLNLNNQTWSRPVVFEGLTSSMKYTRILNDEWIGSLTAGGQRLVTDDRLAYPYGCSSEGNYDRYCSNGTYDLYDYRSENERRDTNAVKVQIDGKIKHHQFVHHLNFGSWFHTAKDRMSRQANNFVGEGSVDSGNRLPSDSGLTNEGTNRDSSHLDFFTSDRIEYKAWNLWLGVRHSRLRRKSQLTDGTRFVEFKQNFLLPWSALSYQFTHFLSYISYGEGIESFVTPNKVEYQKKGQYIPGVISRQAELGFKGSADLNWNLAFFIMRRPVITDLPPDFKIDGEIKQRGLEASIEESLGPWYYGISYIKLEVKRENSKLLAQNNNKTPVNIPDQSLRSFVGHDFKGIKGLRTDLRWIYESDRAVLSDNSIMLPAWNKWDMSLSYSKNYWSGQIYVENLFLKRYWKESPTQYGHVYLFPGSDRKVTMSLQYNF